MPSPLLLSLPFLPLLLLNPTHASETPPPQPQVPLHSYTCPSSSPTSCSSGFESSSVDACCVPSPAGLVLFRQRFEPTMGDEGRWSIDGVEILDCTTHTPPPLPPSSTNRPYTHEQIASFCTTSHIFQDEYTTWESEWAESEVGEGVEEGWERVWRTAGRRISTLEPKCFEDYIYGEEVPVFFDTIHHLHEKLPSWQFLARKGITPSNDITYGRDDILSALRAGSDYEPIISCLNETIHSIIYPLLNEGKFQDGKFVSAKGVVDVDVEGIRRLVGVGAGEECPSEGIHYPPIENQPLPTSSTYDPLSHSPSHQTASPLLPRSNSPRPITDDSNNSEGEVMGDRTPHGVHDKEIGKERLGFFKRADDKREERKEREDGWGQRKGVVGGGGRARDEL